MCICHVSSVAELRHIVGWHILQIGDKSVDLSTGSVQMVELDSGLKKWTVSTDERTRHKVRVGMGIGKLEMSRTSWEG